jgi:hypothetical protein
MTQRDNILNELKELESSLISVSIQNIYSIPEGYFESLADKVLLRIKALELNDAVGELSVLSPGLANLSKQVPYVVPAGYFEELPEKTLRGIHEKGNVQSAKEELESLSPLLSSLKKEMPFNLPEGYFDTLPVKKEVKVISISSRKWFRYAAAAILVGVISTIAILINNNANSEKSFAKFEKKVDKEIKKASDKELTEFAELTSESKDLAFNDNKDEVKELLKDVPEAELLQFIDEIADPEIVKGASME